MTYEDKNILARYLIGDWDFNDSEAAEASLREAIDKAQLGQAVENDRPIRWTSTPSIEAEEIAKKFIYM